ncbi:putative calcium-transporting ATPase 11, plasma membrane-type isoform X2 [Prunus avium]|uniref:Calcium-transporting ATPase n=1 Tax=Prunus avium TaxID=42229 RepID=A0A6P5U1Q2_PRUAV|nr:putative calcium-transporting ATPase 11, plasma membrane-type isoform X2 [Prunus avium]
MERYLKDFEVESKNPSEETIRRWRKAVALVKNPRRRFRFVADLAKRNETEKKKRQMQEKIRVARYIQKPALQFIDAGAGDRSNEKPGQDEYKLSEDARTAGFSIHPDELASITLGHDITALKMHGGIHGILRKVSVSLDEGVKNSNIPIRQNVYGINRYTEKPPRTFFVFVWEALQDLTLIILMVCAVVSVGVGIATEGWPKGMYDCVGILISIILVVMVTAISDYRQSLQFKDLDREKKKIFVQVTRDKKRQKVSIYDLVVGDIVHLSIGDQVPADGIFISGYTLLIDESSLSGESEPVNVYEEKPFLFSGTKVQDGSGIMLVTTVGMRTEWGMLMETLSEGGEDETPLQVKLNGVATIIGKIGLTFAVLTFLVLAVRFLVEKILNNEITDWSSTDAVTLLNYFAIAVTIIVVAVPEGLPLAVTLSLAFAMKKLMNDRALVRHLSACETMGSASCICTNKTGTLTMDHMVVNKIWICEKPLHVKGKSKEILSSEISGASSILLQVIFQNTSSEVIKEDGKTSILGTPTESALLEFGLLLGGDFDAVRREANILKVDPFNSVRKKMSVLVAYPHGGKRAFCKGASEIVLGMCNKFIDFNGESVILSQEQEKNIKDVIDSFASESLRTLCLAFKNIDDSSIENDIPDNGYTLIAVVGIKDPVCPGVKDAVQTCLAAGITVRMVTGDNIYTAKAIATECGILTEDGLAIEGQEFRKMSLEQKKAVIPRIQVMAQSLPLDKHALVKTLRDEFGEVVAVTGDGTNDAPALHKADIGLAMGIVGTEVAKESADVIILDDNFKTIVNVARWGRSVYINIQKFVQFQLTVNVVALIINFVSACVSGSAPLTSVQLLWVSMIMDTLGALALATEPPNDGLMKSPPVRRGTSFITEAMWWNIIGQSIYQLIVLGVLNFYGKQLLGLSGSDATEVLDTVIFNTFVFFQVFNEINSRDIEKINIFVGMFDSWVFLGVMVCTVAFQVIIVEFLGAFASTVPLSWQLWLLSILLGSVSMLVAVVLKNLRRRFRFVTDLDKKRQIQASSVEWAFLLSALCLEILSLAFDQASSPSKPHYALFGMILAIAAVLICIWELIDKGKRERVVLRQWGRLWWFYYPDPPPRLFGTVLNFYGLVGGIAQCICSTVQYVFFLRHADNPIKVSLWPAIFVICLGAKRLNDNRNEIHRD